MQLNNKINKQILIIYLHAVKEFQVLLFIVCTQLNDFKYCYLTFIILLDVYYKSQVNNRIIVFDP